ncbi:hypothetical protein Q3G72_014442 [Acer saccharum]|nr:hypothetical protein Q3G72_014442 [Acer saccharum]
MANTRSVYFSGKIIETTVTDKASIADAWVVNISSIYGGQKIVVGLDSEWRPHPNRDMDNTTAVLQLCVDTKCLIVQMFFMDYIPESLKNFLVTPMQLLLGLRKPGLKDVARLVVGLEMPKPKDVCRSDWQSRVLDDLQIEYACIDAYASFKIGHKLLKEM